MANRSLYALDAELVHGPDQICACANPERMYLSFKSGSAGDPFLALAISKKLVAVPAIYRKVEIPLFAKA